MPNEQKLTVKQAFDHAAQFFKSGDLAQADNLCRQILRFVPWHPAARHLFGLIALHRREHPVARARITAALALSPLDAIACNNLAAIFKAQGQFESAAKHYRAAILLNPGYAEAHYHLGTSLASLDRFEEATRAYRAAIDLKLDQAGLFYDLGLSLAAQEKTEEAVQALQAAIDRRPDHAPIHDSLGNALVVLGQIEAWHAHYRKAIELDPNYTQAYWHLLWSRQEDGSDEGAILELMEQRFSDPASPRTQKMHFAYALGKAHEDLGNYDKAFDYFMAGNTIRREEIEYAVEKDKTVFHIIKTVFNRAFLTEHRQAGLPDETPIFVVGMPRSGTTLTEQILSCHPDVFGAGEISFLHECIREYVGDTANALSSATAPALSAIGNCYLERIRKNAGSAKRVVDKMTDNFLNIGLISILFPNAKIIHCQRDPGDTCLSILKTFFSSTKGCHYAYDMQELGAYYSLYSHLMKHWQKVAPESFFELGYERLTSDQENETRALLAYCGLDWTDACLEPHKSSRKVRTASSVQVRQPIYRKSVGGWKKYETKMKPLLDILLENDCMGQGTSQASS